MAVVLALKVDRHKLIGHLHEFWWWALDNAKPDGSLGKVSDATIAEAAGWPAKQSSMFVGALLDAGFLQQDETGTSIHDWYDFAGKLNDQRDLRRESNREAQQRRRQRLLSAGVSNDSQQASAMTSDDGHDDKDDSHGLRHHDIADSQHPTVPNRTGPNRTGPTETLRSPSLKVNNSRPGSPRLARPAREARTREGSEPPVSNGFASMGSLLAEHEQRVAAERASQAKPSQPIENSLNGDGDEPC